MRTLITIVSFALATFYIGKCCMPKHIIPVEVCTYDTTHIKDIICQTPDNLPIWEDRINYFVSGENIARAEHFWRTAGVLPSVYLAHAALETGYGTSTLVKKTNNRGNIKTKGKGIRAYDKIEKSNDKYAIFETVYLGEKEIINLFKRFKDTKEVLWEVDYRKWTTALENSPYSTDTQYAEKLNSIIRKFSLYNLDHAILREDKIINFEKKIISCRA